MRDALVYLRRNGRDVLFAVFALCTLWLVVQNTLLVAMMPWERLPGALRLAGTVARAVLALGVPMLLVVATIALSWIHARPRHTAGRQEVRHD
jgi:hypothetical protein